MKFWNLNFLLSLFAAIVLLVFTQAANADIPEQQLNKVNKIQQDIKHLGLKSISVHADREKIQVAGFVDNPKDYQDVEHVINHYAKDTFFINNVFIFPHSKPKPEEIVLEKIINKIFDDVQLPSENFSVRIRDGNAMLVGFVEPAHSPDKLRQLMDNVPGIRVTSNYLQVNLH